jgi:subtilisin family serine protease
VAAHHCRRELVQDQLRIQIECLATGKVSPHIPGGLMKRRRALMGLIVAAVGAVAPVVGTAPAGAATAAPGMVPSGQTVTLITGDEVTVGGERGADVRPAQGREHVTFFTEKDERGDVHVVPEDALSLVAKGKLDERLFNVTELVRSGYDDASTDRLPLIVDHAGPAPRSAAAQVSREMPAMGATAVSVERSAAYWPVARRAEHVWLDGRVRATLDHSVPQIGAPQAWSAGHTGAGTTVAVLDTGVDATHPDLADAVTGAENFTDSDTTDDRHGHGTHVASTITGNGGKYQGVAPDTKLLNGKVLNDYGDGMDSWVIAGMEWAAANGADVVNMSLGSQLPSDGTDPVSQAVNRITAETGTLFVIAAGNSGPTVGWIGWPAAADAALTVGAVDRNDELADFSSRGPRKGDSAIKPEITAPGVDIDAAKATNSAFPDPDGDGYVSLSGTSMATPHVAGAAAIVAAQHPDWTAEQLKAALTGSAKPKDGLTVFEQGAGRVDVAKATTATVFASPAILNFGLARWPHHDDQVLTKTVAYTNTGAEPVTLDLASTVTGQDGSGAPQGMFTFTPSKLTVPAGGRATATVTADTTVDGPDGVYEGALTATGGDQSVRTPLAVNREIESYDVTIRGSELDGQPADDYDYRFVPVAKPDKYHSYVYKPWGGATGTVTLRLPKGEYAFNGVVQQQVGEDYHNAAFAEPAFMVTSDTELVLDARETKPVSVTVDRPNVKPAIGQIDLWRDNDWGTLPATVFGTGRGFDGLTIKPSTTRSDAYTFQVQTTMAEWSGQSFDGSRYLYHLRHTENGVPQTPRWHYRDADLAKVRSAHATTAPGTVGMRDAFLVIPLPSTLTEYYTPDVPWQHMSLLEMVPGSKGELVSSSSQHDPVTYRRDRTTTVRWGVGVFGPAVSGAEYGVEVANRFQDRFLFQPWLVSDPLHGRRGDVAGLKSVELLRSGEVVPPSENFVDVGPERAEYTLRASADRSAFARLSTRISTEWTFTSEHTEEPATVPLLAVRFAPNLDDHNAAPAGKQFTIPFHVQRNGSDEPSAVDRLAIEVSYDDGATWQPAKVAHDKATVNHPADAEFVSLRSTVSDRDGNTQRLTITRAYALT